MFTRAETGITCLLRQFQTIQHFLLSKKPVVTHQYLVQIKHENGRIRSLVADNGKAVTDAVENAYMHQDTVSVWDASHFGYTERIRFLNDPEDENHLVGIDSRDAIVIDGYIRS